MGFGPTKTLAKLANQTAKTADRKPGAYPGFAPSRIEQVCDFGAMSQAELEQVYAHTDVGAVWGVGKKIASRLNEGGIRTVLDMVRSDAAMLRRQFSVVLEKTLLELRGTSCVDVNDVPAAKQQILASRSFGTAVTQQAGIVEAVSEFASQAAEKLRQQDSVAAVITVFFTISPYRQHGKQHSVSVTMPLVRPTADTQLQVGTAAATAAQHIRIYLNLRRYDNAVATADRAIARRHGYVFARAVKTAALAHAGRVTQAAEALSAIRQIDPGFLLSRLSHYPFVLSEQRYHLYSGLTAAGLTDPDATSAAR